ncbi:hypothetical protein ACHAWT_000842 [Skeletonema menzelii]
MAESSTENHPIIAASAAVMEDPPAASSTASTEQKSTAAAAAATKQPASNSSDFEPPAACIRRLLKQTLPKSTNISKDSLSALSRASGIFILYLTACANDVAREGRRTTIVAKDVIGALKELEFEEFIPAMEKFLEGHRKEERSKKEEKERMKNGGVGGWGGDKRDKGGKFVSKEEEEGGNTTQNDDGGGGGGKLLEEMEVSSNVKNVDSQIEGVTTAEKHPREEEKNNDEGELPASKKQKVEGDETNETS